MTTNHNDGDGQIVQTVRRVDGTLSVMQRWGTILGAMSVMLFGIGVQWAQFQSFKDDFHAIRDDVRQLVKDRDDIKSRVKSLEDYNEKTVAIALIYVDRMRVRDEAQRIVDEERAKQKRQKSGG